MLIKSIRGLTKLTLVSFLSEEFTENKTFKGVLSRNGFTLELIVRLSDQLGVARALLSGSSRRGASLDATASPHTGNAGIDPGPRNVDRRAQGGYYRSYQRAGYDRGGDSSGN